MIRRAGMLASFILAATIASGEPWLGAYVHMAHCFDASSPKEEREASIALVMDRMQRSGLRAIVPYATTSAGEAHYPSEIVPVRSFGDWDPLGVFVREARARGLQVWPAVAMLVCGHDAPRGILVAHPEWALHDANGLPMGYISPGSPDARQWLASVLEEIAMRYQPDGLFLDYLRYPNQPVDLDEASRARLLSETGRDSYDVRDHEDAAFQTFKERCLTELLHAVHDRVRAVAPYTQFGLYTWGAHVAKNHYVAQPWPVWVGDGLIDVLNVSGYCYPRNYGADYLAVFRSRLSEAAALAVDGPKRPVLTFALGVRTSHGEVESASQIKGYIDAAHESGYDGVAVFTLSYLLPNLDACIAEDYLGALTSSPIAASERE